MDATATATRGAATMPYVPAIRADGSLISWDTPSRVLVLPGRVFTFDSPLRCAKTPSSTATLKEPTMPDATSTICPTCKREFSSPRAFRSHWGRSHKDAEPTPEPTPEPVAEPTPEPVAEKKPVNALGYVYAWKRAHYSLLKNAGEEKATRPTWIVRCEHGSLFTPTPNTGKAAEQAGRSRAEWCEECAK